MGRDSRKTQKWNHQWFSMRPDSSWIDGFSCSRRHVSTESYRFEWWTRFHIPIWKINCAKILHQRRLALLPLPLCNYESMRSKRINPVLLREAAIQVWGLFLSLLSACLRWKLRGALEILLAQSCNWMDLIGFKTYEDSRSLSKETGAEVTFTSGITLLTVSRDEQAPFSSSVVQPRVPSTSLPLDNEPSLNTFGFELKTCNTQFYWKLTGLLDREVDHRTRSWGCACRYGCWWFCLGLRVTELSCQWDLEPKGTVAVLPTLVRNTNARLADQKISKWQIITCGEINGELTLSWPYAPKLYQVKQDQSMDK